MAETVAWSDDGVPHSARFGDIYHSESGALAQARHVFLGGSGLPSRWHGRESFCILETGFGLGLNFLATWRAWLDDPARARRLHYVSLEAFPVTADDIARAGQREPEIASLAAKLAANYPLPLPGLHRIEFTHEGATLSLTLALGDARELLPQLRLAADAIYLDGFSPARNPELWSGALFKSAARLAKTGASVATWTIAAEVRKGLAEAGFVCDKVAGLAPKRDALQGRYRPAWPRPSSWPVHVAPPPLARREAIVVGAGIAGASVAFALLARGWRVTVVDAAPRLAAGASGLPAALMVPHVSPDDAPMSRLTRTGAETMRRWMRQLGVPASPPGVLQFVDDRHKARAPASWGELSLFEMRDTARGPARWFGEAVAVEPRAIVAAMLAPRDTLTLRLGCKVDSIVPASDGRWAVRDARGDVIAEAPHVVFAMAGASMDLAREIPDLPPALAGGAALLRPVRGQITLGAQPLAPAPTHPLSGDGHLVPAWRDDQPWRWLVGASFERGETALTVSDAARASNLEKLARLKPEAHAATTGLEDWVQIRCASPDRLPLAGPLPGLNGLHIVAALGSRGLSLAAVVAELLAARLQEEPWPIDASLAAAVDPARFA